MSIQSAYLIMDGQWGSTGKGLIAGYLATRIHRPDGVICNFGPNAGHTVVFPNKDMVMTQQLPTAIISPSVSRIFIGPGAIINPIIFMAEVHKYRKYLDNKHIFIHPRAAVIQLKHLTQESESLKRISSTQKGVGAAITSKIMREEDAIIGNYEGPDGIQRFVKSVEIYEHQLDKVKKLQIESAQGFELGLNTGSSYPYCTSRDVIPYQIFADCGLPYTVPIHDIVVSLRTYPIRVGHQYEANGVKVGDSGPVYPDQEELQWSDISLAPKPETTTVTGKVRRVFTFSLQGYKRMLKFLSPSNIFLNFVNYLDVYPDIVDRAFVTRTNTPHTIELVDDLNQIAGHSIVTYLGTGPRMDQVI